jgi:hypothetical protein
MEEGGKGKKKKGRRKWGKREEGRREGKEKERKAAPKEWHSHCVLTNLHYLF